MRSKTLFRTAILAIFVMASSGHPLAQSPLQTKYEGTITDYVQALGTTWLVSGDWSLELEGRSGTGKFTASLSMFDTANPAAVAHTHHVALSGGELVVSEDWSAPGTRFTVSGEGLVTGNGGPSYPGAPVTIAITGGDVVTYSNIRLTLGGDAAAHFGPAALGGVVKPRN